MANIFLRLLNMSLTAGVLVVAVVLLRLAFCKAPRWIHCLLWALVAVRLLCPFVIESDFSLMPSAATVPVSTLESTPEPPTTQPIVSDTPAPSNPVADIPVIDTPVVDTPVIDTPVVDTPVIDTPAVDAPIVNAPVEKPSSNVTVSTPAPKADTNPWQMVLSVASWLWLAGMLAMAIYAAVTTLRLRRQVVEAAHLRDNLWQCDHLRSPFILGVFRPRIYLPSDLDGMAQDSVVAHEQAHLHRRDHWWKSLGFLLLTVYWFNPLMWVAYILLCRDIEAACDERVVRDMNAEARRSYSEALLACSAPRRLVSACPLAFGETSVKSRIKSVLSYKKPTIWIIVAALLVSTVAGVCLLTDRPIAEQEPDEPPSVTDKDDTPDTAKTAPVGLTHVAGGLGRWQEETLQSAYVDLPEGTLPIKAFASYDELDAFLSTYDEGKIQRADFTAFDADWFADNTLLMTYYAHPTTLSYPKVDSYVYSEDGTGLTVRLHVYVPSFGDDAFSSYHIFSGIRKSDLEGVKTLTAVVAATIPNDYYVAAIQPTEHPEKAVEKWRCWLPTDEAWALERMLSEWDDAARWGDAQSVNRAFDFATVFNLHGHTHYLATDYSALLRDDGALLWLNEEEGAFLRWIAAYYDEENEELLYLASSHPTSYDHRYAAVPVVLNSPELKAIVDSNRWETISGDVSSYGRFTLGGTVYHIDRTRERIVYANDNNTALYAVYLTAEELAAVDGILAATPWVHTDYMVGKVTQVSMADDYVTVKLTDSSKYTSDISDGTEVRVSLRYYVGEMPAVGSSIRVTYDGYVGSYYDSEGYHPLIHAHSVTVTTQPTDEPVEKWLDYTVIVKDQDGNPISGVKISISSEMIADTITTDSKGVAKANLPEGVPTGTIEVPQGYVVASKKFDFAAGSTSLTIVLKKEQPVTPSTTAKVTFVKFSSPSQSPSKTVSCAQYMSPVQPDAATCDWLRELVTRTDWVKKDTYSGAYDAYFTIGEDENFYYIDRVNRILFHNRQFLPLSKEEVSKLDALIRGYGIQLNSKYTGTAQDWTYITGRVQEYVDGEDGYVLLKVDYRNNNLYGDTVKVSTRFIPRQFFAEGKTVCVVFDGEPDVETTPFTIYAGAMNELKENAIVSTGVPLYDDLLRQIQTHFYDRSTDKPTCSSMIWDHESLSEVGVKLVDLDKDGQDELVIDETDAIFWIGIYDVYTIKDGKLVHLFSSEGSDRYALCKGGYVCKEWSGKNSISNEDYFRIEGDNLVFLEGVSLQIGSNTAGSCYHVTIVNGEKQYEPITLEEAEKIAAKYGKDDVTYHLPVIPFSL
ncbi:MAG: hypothetical protein IKA50_05210 [Clostridia bacterium]|nr:hypothetical protein [Clostridia bacterium]